jgi:hypothetical protein
LICKHLRMDYPSSSEGSADSPYGNSGLTAQEQLDRLTQQKTAISVLFRDNESLLENLSDQDWISYIDRDKSFGEEAALRWVVSKYGQK